MIIHGMSTWAEKKAVVVYFNAGPMSLYSPGDRKTYEKPDSGYPVSRPRFKTAVPQTQVYIVTANQKTHNFATVGRVPGM
jgi:hypothetical protein